MVKKTDKIPPAKRLRKKPEKETAGQKTKTKKQDKTITYNQEMNPRDRASCERAPSRATLAIAFIERYCKIPDGMYVGQPLILDQFQRKFFIDLLDNPHVTRQAILSAARKNAKTVTIACLVLVFLVGPEAKQNSQIVSGAMSKEQAALVFDACVKMIELNEKLKLAVKIVPTVKTLVGVRMNVKYRALSAEGKTAHGLSPVVVIYDELGQVVGPKSDFYDALKTSQGAHEHPLMIIISTQAQNDMDLLSILIDDAISSKDPKIICHLYTTPESYNILDEIGWHLSNPALGKFRSIDDVREQALQASRMPSAEATFRNLILNQRVTTSSPFVSKNTWYDCNAEPCPIEDCLEIYGGLDLSKRTALTALVLFGLSPDGFWNSYCWFWTPEIGLKDRAKTDRAPYDIWVDQGYINTTPGATIDYEFVAQEMAEIFSDIQITALGFDRWRMDILKKEMEKIGLDLPMVEWGQGFKDMSPALDAIEEKILNKIFRHGGNPVLTMCAANAKVITDPAGNRKVDKMKATGRNDGFVALAIAAGVAERKNEHQGDFDSFLNNPIRIG